MRRAGAFLAVAALLAGLGALAFAMPRGEGLAPAAARTQATPRRIVSLNPCADAVLMQVARPEQIAAISHYSHDPRASSLPLDVARRFRATGGTAEEVVALRPDLVIAGSHVALPTILMLRRLGVPLLQLPVPAGIEEDAAQTAQIARAVGGEARGRALNARIAAALAAAAPPPGSTPLPALIWQGGGMVPGEGTMADALLARTGFRNMSADYGLAAWDILPLEHLLARPPATLLLPLGEGEAGEREAGERAAGERALGHPALAKLHGRIALHDFPPMLLHCAGPTLIEAAERLARIRRGQAGA